jgi:hypothetical protein
MKHGAAFVMAAAATSTGTSPAAEGAPARLAVSLAGLTVLPA